MFYLAVPQIDVEVDELTVFLYQFTDSGHLKELSGFFLHSKTAETEREENMSQQSCKHTQLSLYQGIEL